ncbi:uncharacterized protein LOC131841987 [Achroia grisella]|uniref:uncharacterized protein LOC131841987 n=1 Tax=Achroia grisella TaxID=688607 RepID=UPI0027D29904|nr:uncharacterized protein LOC131841987 [Achroia grisella]
MDMNSHISLIDLSKQFPFEIDNRLKDEICFGETLIISCGHYDGDIAEDLSDSEWSCEGSAESEINIVAKDDTVLEIKDGVMVKAVDEQIVEEENNFQFYFFPACNKPISPKDSKASLIIVNGLPQINTTKKNQIYCTCKVDKKGKCECHIKLPCECGAKTVEECVCSKLDKICICHNGKPQTSCICKGSDVCVCHPDGHNQPICVCDNIDKPCVCYPGKFPNSVCICKHKPKYIVDMKSVTGEEENQTEKQGVGNDVKDEEPCDCQNCQNCKTEDSKSICSCPILPECNCDVKSLGECTCFPKPLCTCGDPGKCKCFVICECIAPCICDTKKVDIECICLDKTEEEATFTCPHKKEISNKIKRVRDGKYGYRWCHDVDPRHTYFDYGYGRHDEISYKFQEQEKLKILGLYEENKEEVSSSHEIRVPAYEKKTRKASVDCCSAVGGISISVEVLGEDKDKFLVQVVSHSSKEGAKTGSKLVSILDCNLHTMEENRTEHITKKNITKERRNYMTICESGYYNKVTRICGERHIVKRFYHTFEEAHDFLLEGANVVILRYFGLRRYRGNIKTATVLMDGTLCESIYVCHGVSQAIVNSKPLFVVKVERHIIEPSGCIHQTLTVLTLRGYIVSHEWADNSYILHLNPLLRIIPEKDEIEQHAPLRENWRQDLQLLSDYLDFKSTRTSEGARYVTENGALTETVRDYLQALLLLKPHDALHFTRQYFSGVLSALDLPHDEYFDPTAKHVRYYFFEE